VPAEIKAGRGVKGIKYLFDLDCKAIHPDALITWYDYGAPKVGPRSRGYWRFIFQNEKDYVLTVVANWTDSRGKKWTVSSPEVKFHIGPQPTLTLTIPADNGPDAQYVFTVEPNNLVPKLAFYSWWIDDVPVKELEVDYLQYTSDAGHFQSDSYPHEYKIKVKAEWLEIIDGNHGVGTAYGYGTFTVSGGATIALNIPSGGLGPDAPYTFTAVPNNVPRMSFYSWWIDDVPEKELEVDLLQFAAVAGRFKSVSYPHEYKIKVKAEWPEIIDGKPEIRTAYGYGTFIVKGQRSQAKIDIGTLCCPCSSVYLAHGRTNGCLHYDSQDIIGGDNKTTIIVKCKECGRRFESPTTGGLGRCIDN
jgi:hypothetical protein